MERVMELEEIEDRLRGELRRAKSAENRLIEIEQELSEVQNTVEDLETKVENLQLENNTLRNELHSSGSNDSSHNEANIEKIMKLEHSKADLTKEKEHLIQNI
jgi:regulator of replication initiation timing